MPSSSGSSRPRTLTHSSNISWKAGSSPLVPSGKPNVCVCVCVCVCVYQFSSVHLLSRAQLFATPWTKAHQASLSITNSQSLLKLLSIKSEMSSNHLILCCPFSSHLQAFPGSGSFQVSQFFVSCGQSIGVSASTSVLPKNIQD